MPTAAKLIAGIALAMAAYGVSHVLLFRWPDLEKSGISHVHFAIIGFMVGWAKLGAAAEKGYWGGWRGGASSAILVYFFCSIFAALHGVYSGFFYHAYRTVDEMFTGFFNLTLENASYIADWPTFIAAIAGGMIAGTFAAMAGRLWR